MPRPGYDLSSEEFEDTKWVIKICKFNTKLNKDGSGSEM
jgi:hypothetical protein